VGNDVDPELGVEDRGIGDIEKVRAYESIDAMKG
jgi:hypothetical protein